MPSYIVVLSLKRTKDDLGSRLSEELIRMKGHRVEDQTWLVDVNGSATKLQKYLAGYLESDETSHVSELTSWHEFVRRSGLTGEWLRQHPPLR